MHTRARHIAAAFASVLAATVIATSCGGGDGATADVGSEDASAGEVVVEEARAPSDADVEATPDSTKTLVDTCNGAPRMADAWLGDPNLCLTTYAEAMTNARQFAFAPNGDLFVVAAKIVVATFDLDKNGVIDPMESATFGAAPDGERPLTHGLAFSPDGAFVYASSDTTIYRWAYAPGAHVASGGPEVVVHDMPVAGHFTRTLLFDSKGALYVNVGSNSDVDEAPEDIALRGMIRRFVIPGSLPPGGLAYSGGEVYAAGFRNEVGMAIDSKGRFWGVENGSDGSYMPSVTVDNPAEELNRLDAPGPRFFGYPRCWTERGFAGGLGAGTQWAYSNFALGDAWCRDPANVQKPAFAMQGHWAPLGVAEYTGNSLPWKGDLFITAHGSSSRSPPVGRLVARAKLIGDVVSSVTPVVGHLGDGGLEEGTWDIRPVDIRTGPDDALYFSDDATSRILRLGYRPP